jgi:RHS repeat-associated protein
VVFHYDRFGNLIAKSSLAGEFLETYVYLNETRLAEIEHASPQDRIYYFINDHLGTPQRIVDENNNIVWSGDFLPFSKVNATVAELGNNFRFPGQYYDAETGLHYNWHRYYDPKLGRYLTPDPIGLIGGINLYTYVQNNPVNWVDPMGLFNILIGAGATAAAPTGGEVAGGVAINPGLFAQKADAGLFASVGATAGVNISADVFVGYVKGGIENVKGQTINQNISVGPISITTFHDPTTGEIIGGTIGAGPGATLVGYSGAYDITGTATIRDFLNWIKPEPEACSR